MNLWSIDIEKLTWEQLDAFLQQKEAETVRLDYKQAVDEGLKKTICAFANTMGGMIVVGLEEDKQNNTCIYPSKDISRLEPMKKSFKESIYQIASQKIYPPVSVQISPDFPNPADETKAIYVIRVDQSAHAPHAYEKNKVYVAERKDNTTVSHEVQADIDLVEKLFERRNKIELKRDAYVQDELARSQKQTPPSTKTRKARRWVSIIPYFPDTQLVERYHCYKVLQSFDIFKIRSQRIFTFPNGAYGLFTTEGITDATVRLTDYGHLFIYEHCPEIIDDWHYCTYHEDRTFTDPRAKEAIDKYVKYLRSEETIQGRLHYVYLQELFYTAVTLYKDLLVDPIRHPSLLHITIGYDDVSHMRMELGNQETSTWHILDEAYRESSTCTCDDLLERPFEVLLPLADRLMYGFSVNQRFGGMQSYKNHLEEAWIRACKVNVHRRKKVG